ncbi:hypothetical protein BKP45_03830 [Anaerobacillus alkalidiazotrophicus]|uniref:histidine kinase n=1 Tax=Anaerobacillus alkalidiazotrophicus TaxID=472963 RepID=A0A1S2MDR9_9BACI|nr:PAS domain-containing sensor histidine kinase [Anaerobacillus alkalidiazotrophicus]OIJ21835.1 hypothetical protein BKP45_03830 [Anaerobacillus alkalidiazotrophicus]
MFKTLRAKLFVFFLLTTFIPLLFVSYISYQSQKQELTKQIEHSLLSHSNYIAAEIQQLLLEQISNLNYLATNSVLKDPSATNEEIKLQFESFLEIYEIYSDVIFVKPDGRVFTSMIDIVVGWDFSSRKWFEIAKEGESYISDIYISPVLEEPILVMAAPVFNAQKEVIGVISPSFNVNYIWDKFHTFTYHEQMASLKGYAYLLNKNGDIIAHPDQNKILTENYFQKNNLIAADIVSLSRERNIFYDKEAKEVTAYTQIEKNNGFDNDWFLAITVSKSALFAPLLNLFKNYVIIMGCVSIIITIAVFQFSKYIVSPVEKLVAATSEFAVGKSIPPLVNQSYKEIERLNGTFTAMTKKLAERESGHKKSTLILETTDNGIFIINKRTTKITMFNRMCEEMFAISREEVINFSVDDVMRKSTHFQEFVSSSQIMNYLEKETPKKYEVQWQIGKKCWYYLVSLTTLPSLDNNDLQEELLIMISDISDKRQMELELVHSEKLKVVGEMSAGLAHEIRNPIATIRGFIQLFSQEEMGSKKSYFDIIIKEIDRVNYIVTDLLNVAKSKSKGEYRQTNIQLLLEEMLVLETSHLKNKGLNLVTEFETVPLIFIDPLKVKQACMNIIQNAIEAMDVGDTLFVATKHLTEENKVCIYIKDTGIGMDPQTLEKLRTPFFTTKDTGTGLGMSTSFRVIEEMQGTIDVLSEEGKGSTFTITLPIIPVCKGSNIKENGH